MCFGRFWSWTCNQERRHLFGGAIWSGIGLIGLEVPAAQSYVVHSSGWYSGTLLLAPCTDTSSGAYRGYQSSICTSVPIPAVLADVQLCSSGGREAQPLALPQLSPQAYGQSAQRSFRQHN